MHSAFFAFYFTAMQMPSILKILAVFTAMVALTRTRIHLGLLLILGGIAMSAAAGLPFSETAGHLAEAAARSDLWLLIFITALIVIFGHLISEKETSAELMAAVRGWGGRHGRAVSLMVVPAVIGLIPMPGGALFSAPLVAQTVGQESRRTGWKSAVNYWFRHVWEHWWPLYPVTMITLSIFPIEIWQYTAAQFPMTLACLLFGWLLLVRPHLDSLADAQAAPSTGNRTAGRVALALLATVLLAVFLPSVLHHLPVSAKPTTRKMASVAIGLAAGLLVLTRGSFRALRARFRLALEIKALGIYLIIAGVVVFHHMLETSGLLPGAAAELVESSIPLTLITILLPFLAGMVTGIAMGFAGTSFPLVAGLLAAPGSGMHPLSTAVLAFSSGYAGMMLSPLHLCLILTRKYFSEGSAGVYRHIIPCATAVWLAAFAMFLVLRSLGL